MPYAPYPPDDTGVEDWEYYRTVNRKFAEALLEEMKYEDNPVVLVQDIHFRFAAAPDQGCPAGRAGRHLLAHSVAQRRGLRHLPLAVGNCSTSCWAPI